MTRKLLISLCAAALLLCGCMADDGECGYPVTLQFVYELHNHGGDRFADEVEHLEVYIYDRDGNLSRSMDVPATSLAQGNTLQVSLPAGSYRAVAWGNIHTGHFAATGTGDIGTHMLAIDCVDAAGKLTGPEPGTLFHGSASFEAGSGAEDRYTMPMTQNSNTLNVHIKGTQDAVIETFVTGANAHYTPDNTVHADAFPVTYVPAHQPGKEYRLDKFQVYRLLATDSDIAVRVVCTSPSSFGTEFECHEALVPILTGDLPAGTDPQDYLDRGDEYDIYLLFATDGTVSVSLVKPWEDVGNETGLES